MKLPLMNKTKYTLSTLLLILIGIILLNTYIWHRFLRQRLPREIPFNLNEYGCIILFAICCTYLFIIITLVIEFKANNNAYITFLIDGLYKPLKTLDEAIKALPIITFYFDKLVLFVSNYITKDHIKKICHLLNIWPRIFLLTILCFDVFYFSKIEYLYQIILISILPLLYKYIIFSLKYAKEQYILLLESIIEQIMTNYSVDNTDNYWNSLPLRNFIDIQADSIFLNDHKFECIPLFYNAYTKKIIEDKGDIKETYSKYTNMLLIVILISVQLQWFTFYNSYDDTIKYIKVAIFSTYLICWCYILIISLPFLPVDAFDWLWIIQDIENPFSLTDEALL